MIQFGWTIAQAINQGLEVIGIRDGFKNLVNGDISQMRTLTIPDVAPYYQKGGSLLGIQPDQSGQGSRSHGQCHR